MTVEFLAVLILGFLGFAFQHILRPVIPLIVIARGGDAILVGAVVGIHALPSLLFRPVIGGLVDSAHHARLLRFSAIAAAVAPVGLLVPSTLPLFATRFVQGSAWATFSVATQTLVARQAPANRRGEAAGYWHMMAALAAFLAPAIGVALYVATGEAGPVLVASLLGCASVVATRFVRVTDVSIATSSASPVVPHSAFTRLIEPSALPATFMTATFTAARSLFTDFAPIYAITVGSPLEVLILYYPIYGLTVTLSQLVGGRLSDRLGRGRAIRIGCGCATVGLVGAMLGGGMVTFTAGAAAYAVGLAFVSPTTSAMTMDRAPAGRLGAAMATYSVGFALATGASGLLWGTIISVMGFPAALVAAVSLQVLTFAASRRFPTL